MINQFYSSIRPEISAKVEALPIQIESEQCLAAVQELLSRSVLQGGKRLRPLLTYLVSDLLDIDIELATPFARAVELVHAASLAHDDVIDNATLRRGNPSINIVGSNKRAVLAGDFLLADVIVSLTKTGHLELVKRMSEVIQDLSNGEWLQLEAAESKQYSLELISRISLFKTSSVMSYCCYAPGILAKLSEDKIEHLKLFGQHVGQAFQLTDDILDFSGDSLKDQFLDLQNGIVNAVTFEILANSSVLNQQFQTGTIVSFDSQDPVVIAAIEATKVKVRDHLEAAHIHLENVCKDLNVKDSKLKPLQLILAYLAARTF